MSNETAKSIEQNEKLLRTQDPIGQTICNVVLLPISGLQKFWYMPYFIYVLPILFLDYTSKLIF